MIRIIEETSLNAWPAQQTFLYDGWVLRFSGGYTRRANSALALYPALLSLSEKIGVCEELYRRQHLPVIFKLPGRKESADLDLFLAGCGYVLEAETSVQTLDLRRWENVPDSSLYPDQMPNAAWEAAFCRLGGLNANQQESHRQILQSILAKTCFTSLIVGGAVVGCGLGVVQDGFLGLFDIIVDPIYREKGYGKRLVRGLLSWGKKQGAHTAYLQVMLNNSPALNLYAGLGFTEVYQYWYRVKA